MLFTTTDTEATEISLATIIENDGVLVTVPDNGQGFDVEQALLRGGKGLANQIRRAESIGGSVNWKSGATGTTFSLWLPVASGG